MACTDIFELIAAHEAHRVMGDPVEKLFGKVAMHERQTLACVTKLCERLEQAKDTNEHINLSHACLSLAIGK